MRRSSRLVITLIALLIATPSGVLCAQSGEPTDTEDDSMFADPFAVDTGDDSGEESQESGTDGESDDPFADLDSLFEEDMVEEVEDPTAIANPEQGLLESEMLEWGGRIRGQASSEWRWNTTQPADFDPIDPTDRVLTPSVSADLYFDARPDPGFRAFGKLKLESSTPDDATDLAGAINQAALTGDLPEGWSREEEEDGDTVIRDENGDIVFTVAAEDEEEEQEYEPETGSAPSIDLSVFELFSDFNYRERLFFRFGKHTIQWGVGYFFSPSDVLNLTAVDAEDPTADRQGPVSLKVHYPFSVHNAYLYLITNTGIRPLETAVAPKLELVVGRTEFTFAGYYQRALAPRVIGMFSSSIEDLDLFGEAVLSIGSDRVFVRESRKTVSDFTEPPEGLETVLDTYTVDWAPLFSGTVGARYLHDFDSDNGSVALLGQYFFNGEGYPNSSLLAPAAFLAQNPDTNGLAIPDEPAQPEDYEAPPELGIADLQNWGRHYIAASVSLNNMADSDISASLFGLVNLSDLSGIVTPSVSFPVLEVVSTSISGRLTFGNDGDEYTNPAALVDSTDEAEDRGGTFALTVSFGLGGGSF